MAKNDFFDTQLGVPLVSVRKCVVCGLETEEALVHKCKEKPSIGMCITCAKLGYVRYYEAEFIYTGGNL